MNNALIIADKIKQKARCLLEEATELMNDIKEDRETIERLTDENRKLKEQIKPNHIKES